tara:strand:+ start:131460 stop:132542 length:1083 start_codon:yes stop_codon:yes gene_type:complete
MAMDHRNTSNRELNALFPRSEYGKNRMKTLLLGGLLITSTLFSGATFAMDTITAVHAFPKTLIYSQSFLEFVDRVNEQGKGIVEIEVRGGPEEISMFEQADAVRHGVVDMAYSAGSFYGDALPEKDAMVASSLTAIEARQNGGIDLINEIHQEKMGVYYLGWFDSGVTYNLWTKNKPAFDDEGNLKVDGLKLRSNAVYNAFFSNYLKEEIIDLPATDVFSALETGVIDATGWTQIGLLDFNWHKFLNYRIEPNFFSTDLGVIVNLEKWNSLSDEARNILQQVAIEHEISSVEKMRSKRDEDFAALEKEGMQVVFLEGQAKENFLGAAREITWDRMKKLMAEQPGGTTNYDRLIALFNGPE